ncbi:MAG: hypothetical protein MJ066_03890 [Clostridia bacterium]|nr:hypothetical protein [Clostridia bacterium]
MIDYFDLKEWEIIKEQKRKAIAMYFVSLLIYLLFAFGFYAWYLLSPYGAKIVILIKWVVYPVTFIYAVISMLVFGIKYKRIKSYYNKCVDLATGIKETNEGTFLRYSQLCQVKDGVDFKNLIFSEWNKYKNEYYDRKVLVFYEKPFPDIPTNSKVKYITQGNVLISYEIISEEIQCEQ